MPDDPEHHDIDSFNIKVNANDGSWHNSENQPIKNFYRENFDVINACLDMDWKNFLGDSDVTRSSNKFYPKLYKVINNNAPNVRSCSTSYLVW